MKRSALLNQGSNDSTVLPIILLWTVAEDLLVSIHVEWIMVCVPGIQADILLGNAMPVTCKYNGRSRTPPFTKAVNGTMH